MGRKVRQSWLEAIWNAIIESPGARPGAIAGRLGRHRSEVTRSLPAMEAQGYYLAEDERGGLWPFKRKGPG